MHVRKAYWGLLYNTKGMYDGNLKVELLKLLVNRLLPRCLLALGNVTE